MIKQKIKNHKIFSLLIVGFLRYSGYSKECIAAVLLSQNESESCLVMSDSLLPHGLYSPWNSPGQNTRAGSFSQISHDITFMWSLKKIIQMNLSSKQKQTHIIRK